LARGRRLARRLRLRRRAEPVHRADGRGDHRATQLVDQPLATGYCGDHWQWNGTKWQWTGPLSSCNGWTWNEFVQVIEGPDGPGGLDGSTVGLADMNTSVQAVRSQILLVWAATGGQQIDVAAHSQGAPVVRAAIRQLEAEATAEDQDGDGVAGHHDIVHTMVSLGGADYGISVTAPESWPAGWGWYSESVLRDCRKDGWLPVCPDIIRDYADATGGLYLRPNPYDPGSAGDPFNQDHPYWGLIHKTAFYPNLNALTGDGPTPGNTIYHHLYTENDPTAAVAGNDGERIELHDDGPNVENRSVQDFCGDPGYLVDHVGEWLDPAMQELVLDALGIRAADPAAC
jgi:hypothetical protein